MPRKKDLIFGDKRLMKRYETIAHKVRESRSCLMTNCFQKKSDQTRAYIFFRIKK